MAEIMLRDGTLITVSKTRDQPENLDSWDDGVRWRVMFGDRFIGLVESWRDSYPRVRRRHHPKRWKEYFSLGTLNRLCQDDDEGATTNHPTRNTALESLVTRYCRAILRERIMP